MRVCWCPHLTRIETRTPVVIVQHPRERHVAIGTARMASLCLPQSRLFVGVDCDNNPELQGALSDPAAPPVLLWPGPDARDLGDDPPDERVTLVVIDGTWALARKLLRVNPGLARLPRYKLPMTAPSRYRIRREPRVECVSTIEAIERALGLIERDPTRFESLLRPFDAMIDAQIDLQQQIGNERVRRHKAPAPRRVPPELADLSRLVILSADANAWAGPDPPRQEELVHCVAVRAATGERFEAVVAPRGPLNPVTPEHLGISAEAMRAGLAQPDFVDALEAFLKPDDLLGAWGPFAPKLLANESPRLQRGVVDLRAMAGRWLRRKPGGLDAITRELVNEEVTSLGLGRGGERAAQMLAVVQAFRARGEQPPANGSLP